MTSGRFWVTVLLALCGFAANSLLARGALAGGSIDAASFTFLRLASGAAFLTLVHLARARMVRPGGTAVGAASLFGYAALFSWAYLSLTAATGALILFGAVQATMIAGSVLRKERRSAPQWVGFAVAAGGLIWLLWPGVSAPPPLAAASMAAAGVCWGVYSLLGVSGSDPLAATAGNFLRAAPFGLLWCVIAFASADLRLSGHGVALAIVSGALTSGGAYAGWYTVLPALGRFRAAIAQLSVPALTALAAVALLSEDLSLRLVVAEVLILSGVGGALLAGQRRA